MNNAECQLFKEEENKLEINTFDQLEDMIVDQPQDRRLIEKKIGIIIKEEVITYIIN